MIEINRHFLRYILPTEQKFAFAWGTSWKKLKKKTFETEISAQPSAEEETKEINSSEIQKWFQVQEKVVPKSKNSP